MPALVGSDFNLAEHLWDDILGPTENVIQSLEEYARYKGLRNPFEIENYGIWRIYIVILTSTRHLGTVVERKHSIHP